MLHALFESCYSHGTRLESDWTEERMQRTVDAYFDQMNGAMEAQARAETAARHR